MLTIEKVDITSKKHINEFVQFHYDLYQNCPQWVPPFYTDIKTMLNPQKHPFYEHSDAEFFVARQDGKIVGRIGAMENKPFNKYHETKKAQFYLFDCYDDQEVANALFNRAFEWAKQRGLTDIVGPKGFGPLDGYGILTEGFDQRQMMIMMNYNYPYYAKLLENMGFECEVDFISCYMARDIFTLPEKVKEVSRRVKERGIFGVQKFETKAELKRWANRIGDAYNKAFVNNWEYYPLSDNEIKSVVDNILTIADHKLIKIITYKENTIGFLFGFPDVSAAMQRQKGKITPWGMLDILRELKHTSWISLNGAGILPEYHGRGANALLYTEMEDTIKSNPKFLHAELTQVSNTAVQMRKDLMTVGGKEYKNHRVFHRKI